MSQTPTLTTLENLGAPVVPQRRLHFLDGLRGLACLYVLLFHEVTAKVVDIRGMATPLLWLRACLDFGHFSVVFFIVLSGFSLMLPIARSGQGKLVGGFGRYIFRRARRILPPYYVALALSAGLIVAFNTLGSRLGLGQRVDDAALSTGAVASHLLLVQNLRFDWVYRVNAPMWSVATEWQIYFVLAVALLPLSVRMGPVKTAAIAWVIGSLPFFLLPKDDNFFWACPWFIGSFALGMWGALLNFSAAAPAPKQDRLWSLAAAVAFGLIVVSCLLGWSTTLAMPFVDLLVSGFAFALINACVSASRGSAHPPLFLRILESRPLVYLGGFSYSLYLVQHPILRLFDKALQRLHCGPNANILIEWLLVTPVALAIAWVFSEFFERPFSSGGVVLPAIGRRVSWLDAARSD